MLAPPPGARCRPAPHSVLWCLASPPLTAYRSRIRRFAASGVVNKCGRRRHGHPSTVPAWLSSSAVPAGPGRRLRPRPPSQARAAALVPGLRLRPGCRLRPRSLFPTQPGPLQLQTVPGSHIHTSDLQVCLQTWLLSKAWPSPSPPAMDPLCPLRRSHTSGVALPSRLGYPRPLAHPTTPRPA